MKFFFFGGGPSQLEEGARLMLLFAALSITLPRCGKKKRATVIGLFRFEIAPFLPPRVGLFLHFLPLLATEQCDPRCIRHWERRDGESLVELSRGVAGGASSTLR